jgi:pimeloyl-ACP methyl ester carboxylesterase
VEALADRLAARVEVAPGVRLDVAASGSGPSVLLIPGFGTDASAFAPQIPQLAEEHRVLAMNPRGLGFSDAPESERYDIAIAAADAARIIGETPAHVVGASLGAATAIELALQRPELVRSLTLITPLVATTGRLEAVMEAWCALAAAGDRDVLARFLAPWMFSERTLKDRDKRERIVRALGHTVSAVRAEVLMRWAAGAAAWSGSRVGDLARITAPTLVLAAGADLLTPDAAGSLARFRADDDQAAGRGRIEEPAAVTRNPGTCAQKATTHPHVHHRRLRQRALGRLQDVARARSRINRLTTASACVASIRSSAVGSFPVRRWHSGAWLKIIPAAPMNM